jgi:hypothetical protein
MEIPVQINGKPILGRAKGGPCTEFAAETGEIYKIKMHTKSIKIQCLNGALWVTKENDPEDYILRRGQEVTFSGRGVVIIQTLLPGKWCILSK